MIRTQVQVWRAHLVQLVVVIAALIGIFWQDVADMSRIWWTISTYTHCLFILPLVGWLIWQRREELMTLTPRSFAPGVSLVFISGLFWMLGQVAGVALFRHAGLVFMMQSSVLTILGPQVTRGLLFPLFYLVFLIPLGDELVPALQTITAKLSMIFLGWAGIPAHIEGVFISIPTGLFEVAEACSGVKFLVAMVAYAALAANVCFKSWSRRIVFMAVAIAVPILANGLRAYGTIHISYVTGNNDFAASFDHIIFGWIFFALVMTMLMAAGWKFFDRGIGHPWLGNWAAGSKAKAHPARWSVSAAVLAAAIAPLGWQSAMASRGRVPVGHVVSMPDVPGWKRVPAIQSFPWKPSFKGADQLLSAQYVNAVGQRVDLVIALYGWQEEGKEIVGYGQGAFDPRSPWSWANDTAALPGAKGERIFAPGVEREVISFYRLGGMTTGNPTTVKIETLKERLTGGDQSAVAILVSAENSRSEPSRPIIDAFLHNLENVDTLAERTITAARGR
jgi:exosortase A